MTARQLDACNRERLSKSNITLNSPKKAAWTSDATFQPGIATRAINRVSLRRSGRPFHHPDEFVDIRRMRSEPTHD